MDRFIYFFFFWLRKIVKFKWKPHCGESRYCCKPAIIGKYFNYNIPGIIYIYTLGIIQVHIVIPHYTENLTKKSFEMRQYTRDRGSANFYYYYYIQVQKLLLRWKIYKVWEYVYNAKWIVQLKVRESFRTAAGEWACSITAAKRISPLLRP